MKMMKIKNMKKMSHSFKHMSRKTWTGIGVAITSLLVLWGVMRWRSHHEETLTVS